MLCVDVHHNGRRVARAGLRQGVLSGMVSWVSRKGKTHPDQLAPGDVVPGLECRVGGLNTARSRNHEHVVWWELRELRLGDEIVLRAGRFSRADRPIRRKVSNVEKGRRRGADVIRCSFCGQDRPQRRSKGQAGVMVGAGGAVCSLCVGAAQLLRESGATKALHLAVRGNKTCSFCGRVRSRVVATGKSSICQRCLEKVSDGL